MPSMSGQRAACSGQERRWFSCTLHAARCTLLLLLVAVAASAAPPTTCGGTDEYSKALCAYQKRDFATAEAGFRAIVDREEPDPQTLHALYFLARTEMKTGRYEEAETHFIRIYAMSKAFYDEWNCDFLLGECRKARGKS